MYKFKFRRVLLTLLSAVCMISVSHADEGDNLTYGTAAFYDNRIYGVVTGTTSKIVQVVIVPTARMITAFGTGIKDEFDISKLRYDKIVIMTDADVDGAHIRVLLLTLFYRYFRPIVEAGHVYAAQPPLFRIRYGKTRKYVLDEKERDSYLATMKETDRSRAEITRMKGLGEMDAEELYETTMDINTRVLRKITVDDLIAADAIFEKLMGEEVEPRRQFIEENARYADVDI